MLKLYKHDYSTTECVYLEILYQGGIIMFAVAVCETGPTRLLDQSSYCSHKLRRNPDFYYWNGSRWKYGHYYTYIFRHILYNDGSVLIIFKYMFLLLTNTQVFVNPLSAINQNDFSFVDTWKHVCNSFSCTVWIFKPTVIIHIARFPHAKAKCTLNNWATHYTN